MQQLTSFQDMVTSMLRIYNTKTDLQQRPNGKISMQTILFIKAILQYSWRVPVFFLSILKMNLLRNMAASHKCEWKKCVNMHYPVNRNNDAILRDWLYA